jgi:hypothetical protein
VTADEFARVLQTNWSLEGFHVRRCAVGDWFRLAGDCVRRPRSQGRTDHPLRFEVSGGKLRSDRRLHFLLIDLSRNYLRGANARSKECLILGTVILLVTVVLHTLVYVPLLASPDYFAYLSVWISYALSVGVPWIIGRDLQ